MTDWPLLECIENKEEFIEKLKKLGIVKRDWEPKEDIKKPRLKVINGGSEMDRFILWYRGI